MVVGWLATGRTWGYPVSSIQFVGHYPGLLVARKVHCCKLKPDTALCFCPVSGLTVAPRTVQSATALLFLILMGTNKKNSMCLLLKWQATYRDKLQLLS